MPTRIGLYYPYLHVRSDEWLKIAALYWPSLAYIDVPGHPVQHNDATQALVDELDFLVAVSPEPAMPDVGRLVQHVLDEHGEQIRGRYRAQSGIWPPQTAGGFGPIYARQFLGDGTPTEVTWPIHQVSAYPWYGQLVGLHASRVEPNLRQDLLHSGLAVDPRDEYGDWLIVHADFAWAYMSALAEALATRNHLSPVTDRDDAHKAAGEWDADRFAAVVLGEAPRPVSPADDWAHAVGLLAIRLVVPALLHKVPIAKIIQIRQRHGIEFDAFHDLARSTAAGLAAELAAAPADPAVVRAYLDNEVKRQFANPLAALTKALRGLGLDTAFKATSLKLELPAAVLTATGGIAAGQPILAGAGAAAFGILGLARSARQNRAELLAGSPVSYLWFAEHGLSAGWLASRLLRPTATRTRP